MLIVCGGNLIMSHVRCMHPDNVILIRCKGPEVCGNATGTRDELLDSSMHGISYCLFKPHVAK